MPIDGKREKKPVIETDITCDKCGAPMVIREGRFGKFIACSAFPECRNTKPLKAVDGDMQEDTEKQGKKSKSTGRKKKSKAEPSGETCEKCGREMVWRKGKWGKFLACSGYPQCRNTKRVKNPDESKDKATGSKKKKSTGKKKKNEPEPSGEVCEKCGKEMVWRKGKWGKFLACSGYPRCRNTRKGAENE